MAFLLLVAAGLFAGYVNAIAGAGSLLTLPALIFSGLDASAANATNRIAVLTNGVTSAAEYHRGGVRLPRTAVWPCLSASAGAAGGAYLATLLDASQVAVAIAVVMVVMLVLTLVRPASAGERGLEVTPGMVLAFGVMGVYAGFIQAGTGVLVLMFLSLVHRTNLVVANGLKVVVNLVLTVVALAVFAGRGETIDLARGLVLGAATGIGGVFGARSAVKRGEGFVRLALVVTVLASAVKLLADAL